MQRICAVINVKPEAIPEYERVHADAWPAILATLTRCNVRNFSIYRYNHLLISYMEYIGKDYEADMALIAADPDTKEWWKVTDPMQTPVPERLVNEWWHPVPEVFHLD